MFLIVKADHVGSTCGFKKCNGFNRLTNNNPIGQIIFKVVNGILLYNGLVILT